MQRARALLAASMEPAAKSAKRGSITFVTGNQKKLDVGAGWARVKGRHAALGF